MAIKEFKSLTKGAARLFDVGGTISQTKRDGKTSTIEKSLITVTKANEAVQRNMMFAATILSRNTTSSRLKFPSERKSGYHSIIIKAKDRTHDKHRYYKVSKKRRGD